MLRVIAKEMENGSVVEEANGEQGQLLMRQAETGSVEWLEGREPVSQPNQADHFDTRETPLGSKYSRLGFCLCLLVSCLPQGLG